MPTPVTPHNPIICDLQPRTIERIKPGYLKSCITSATTLGDKKGANSSIYFIGCNNPRDVIALQRSTSMISRITHSWTKYLIKSEKNTMKLLSKKRSSNHSDLLKIVSIKWKTQDIQNQQIKVINDVLNTNQVSH